MESSKPHSAAIHPAREYDDVPEQGELALDQKGSADPNALRRVAAFTALIVLIALGVLAFGATQLPVLPQFTTLHASFIFLVNAIAGFVLLGQFRYRRLPFYAILAGAYLFGAFVTIPFILAFPSALKAEGSVIGGPQSAIWAWHFWHILFPAIVALSLIPRNSLCEKPLSEQQANRMISASIAGAAILTFAVGIAITVFHDSLPVLLTPPGTPLPPAFYFAGGLAATIAAFAAFLAWRHGLRQRTILHLWLAVSLTAFLADIAASLGATGRYTVAWYFGRIESMIAAGILLLAFLYEVNRLYRRLTIAMSKLSEANVKLVSLIDEKDRLVADLQHSEEQVRQLAYYDALTCLPNRRLLLDRFRQALTQAKRHGYSMAVMFLDLDRFKQVNDTLGHDAGDELLRQVAVRITGCIRSGDTVSRSGGDEFILVMAEISHPQDAALVADKIIRVLETPFEIASHPVQIGVSIGIAVYPIDGTDDTQELMKKADMAMYAAKESGRNCYRFYDDGLAAHQGV
ncbi:MAG: GGDEF domain-containing protein [Gallionella sp.]|nr:GGDEF domain-containing protein [Gallionella sp.]MCK9354210.1 GGDEF domain-containing protein [Gallionella sp.]